MCFAVHLNGSDCLSIQTSHLCRPYGFGHSLTRSLVNFAGSLWPGSMGYQKRWLEMFSLDCVPYESAAAGGDAGDDQEMVLRAVTIEFLINLEKRLVACGKIKPEDRACMTRSERRKRLRNR